MKNEKFEEIIREFKERELKEKEKRIYAMLIGIISSFLILGVYKNILEITNWSIKVRQSAMAITGIILIVLSLYNIYVTIKRKKYINKIEEEHKLLIGESNYQRHKEFEENCLKILNNGKNPIPYGRFEYILSISGILIGLLTLFLMFNL